MVLRSSPTSCRKLASHTIASILFVVLLLHLPARIRAEVPGARSDLYADDLLIMALRLLILRGALLVAKQFAEERGLEINWSKTKIVKFRRGGHLAGTDKLEVDGIDVPFVSLFCYLGLTITSTASTFTRHVQDRRDRAIAAIRLLPPPTQLSLQAAIELFRIKLAPMATYAVNLCWHRMKVSDFRIVDSVLACFLRRVLGVSKYTRSRLVMLLANATLTTQDLARSCDLPNTPSFLAYLMETETKRGEVEPAFHTASAMVNRRWEQPRFPLRSILCRQAVHGFHHLLCTTAEFHEPQTGCVCRYCGLTCLRYHADTCQSPPFTSVMQLA
jgi:hypothetical protein